MKTNSGGGGIKLRNVAAKPFNARGAATDRSICSREPNQSVQMSQFESLPDNKPA